MHQNMLPTNIGKEKIISAPFDTNDWNMGEDRAEGIYRTITSLCDKAGAQDFFKGTAASPEGWLGAHCRLFCCTVA